MKSLTKKGGKPVINKLKPIWEKLWSYENDLSDISSEPIYPITEEQLFYINFYNKLYYLNDKEKNDEIKKLKEIIIEMNHPALSNLLSDINYEKCYDVYKSWITVNMFGKNAYSLNNIIHLIKDKSVINSDWDMNIIEPLSHVYNDLVAELFLKILEIVSNKKYDLIGTKYEDYKDNNYTDPVYLKFMWNTYGSINGNFSKNEFKKLYELYLKSVEECNINKGNNYVTEYDSMIGKGGFGSVVKCVDQSKVIKFIKLPTIKYFHGTFVPCHDIIHAIITFLNEIIINIQFNLMDSDYFKSILSFGFKKNPRNQIKKLVSENEEEGWEPEEQFYTGSFYMVMENLGATLENKLKEKISFDLKIKWIEEIMNGLLLIHGYDYCHLDIKGVNIMIGSDNTARIIDYGLVKSTQNPLSKWTGSTPGWYPPNRFIQSLKLNQLSNIDLYHLGLLIYYIILDGHIDFKHIEDNIIYSVSDSTQEDLYKYLDAQIDKLDSDDVNILNLINFVKEYKFLDFDMLNTEPDGELRLDVALGNFNRLVKII
jgi:hypothetical protein